MYHPKVETKKKKKKNQSKIELQERINKRERERAITFFFKENVRQIKNYIKEDE